MMIDIEKRKATPQAELTNVAKPKSHFVLMSSIKNLFFRIFRKTSDADVDYPIVKKTTVGKILELMDDPTLDEMSIEDALSKIFSKL